MQQRSCWLLALPRLSAAAAALALTVSGCAGGAALPGAPAAGGSQRLFNGTDLTGWNGDPHFWRVENGAIVGQTTAENVLAQNTFIRWEGGQVDDFNLRLQFRLTDGNSGVQYRAWPAGGWSVGGYQADMDAANMFTGMIYEEGGRGFVARRGQRVVVEPDGRMNVVGSVGDPQELAARIRRGEWNTLEVTARGNHIVHRVNGRVTAEVTDNHPEGRSLSGLLALQLHTGNPMKVEFRDIVLTPLAPATASR